MSRHQTVDPLEDTGLEWADVATTAAIVYSRLAGVEVEPDDAGWMAVARHAAGMFGYDDGADVGEAQLPVSQLASQLRRAYARTRSAEDDIPEWKELGEKFRLAWEGVTRHMGNVFAMDKAEAGRLGEHENRMIAHMQKLAASRAAQPQ
jgi:hypothetical protein